MITADICMHAYFDDLYARKTRRYLQERTHARSNACYLHHSFTQKVSLPSGVVLYVSMLTVILLVDFRYTKACLHTRTVSLSWVLILLVSSSYTS